MTDIPPTWTTYAQEALRHLDRARGHPHNDDDDAEAQIGIGYALLALVEVLKPEKRVLLEVTSPTQVASVQRFITSEYQRLLPCVGKSVWVNEDDGKVGYLTRIEKLDKVVLADVLFSDRDDENHTERIVSVYVIEYVS